MKRPNLQDSARAGFTLVELLVVIAIIVLLSSLAIPAISSLKKANTLNTATASIASVLDQARSYAMANNTYVFVGFEETDFSTPSNQVQSTGTGRVTVQAFSSLDSTLNLAAGNLAAISRRQIFENIDLPSSLASSTGNLSARPTASYVVGSSNFPAASAPIVSGNFTFTKVMAFDPSGVLHLPTNPPQAGLQYLEIDVQQSNGNIAPAAAQDVSAIQVDGLTGAVTTYRS